MPKYRGVIKRSNKYYYRIYRNGAQKEYGGFSTAEEAFNARNEHLNDLNKGKFSPYDITVRDFIVKYLEDHEKVNNRIATFIKAEGICRNHIVPELGHRKLRSITTADLVNFQNNLIRYKTPSVAHNSMRIVRRILNKAVEWGYLPYSPLKGSIPPPPKKEHPVLSLEQVHEILELLEGRNKYIVALLGLAGLRRSEVFGLKWSDINFKNKTLRIRRQYTQGRIQEAKTDESKATIPMCDDLNDLMKEWKLQSGSFNWVFKGNGEKPLSGEWWGSQQWPKIKELYSFPEGFRIHDFRHSFATILLEMGIPIENVQLLLRHRNLKTTAELYRHIRPARLKKEVSVLNSLYREKYREKENLTP